MKIVPHRSPAIATWISKTGVPVLALVTEREEHSTPLRCTIQTQKIDGRWIAILDCDAIGGRKIHKEGFCPSRTTKKFLEKLVGKIVRAQDQAIELHEKRRRANVAPMPQSLTPMPFRN